MAIKFVRAPSETPNISNIDDFCFTRYAYSDVDGFVKGKGNEVGYEVNGNVFTVKSGRIVLQGTESDIDSNGVNITVDSVSTKRYFKVYLKVNLANNTAQVLSTYDTANYPTISNGDNLTANTTGYAQLELYQFTATSGVITEVAKLIKGIEYGTAKTTINKGVITNDNATDSGKVLTFNNTNGFGTTGNKGYWKVWDLQVETGVFTCALIPSRPNMQNIGEDNYCLKNICTNDVRLRDNNGNVTSLTERLNNLGFKSGSITVSSGGTATTNTLTRQGNYVLGSLAFGSLSSDTITGTFPINFRPKKQIGVHGWFIYATSGGMGSHGECVLTIETSGLFTVQLSAPYNIIRRMSAGISNFGYEANPIT